MDAADFARRENWSFIRLNDAFPENSAQGCPKNFKTTHYESCVQSNTRAERKKTDKLQPEVRMCLAPVGFCNRVSWFCRYKFRPAPDNPYLHVPQGDSDDEMEMEEV